MARDLQFKEVSPLFYLLDPRYGRLDALGERLLVQLLDQRLLDLGAKADLPGRFHFGGIGVDGLSLGEIDQRGKRLGRLQKHKRQPGLPRLQGRGHAGNARADNRQVQDILLPLAALECLVGYDVLYGPRARIGRELQQWDSGQVADDVQPGNIALPVLIYPRQLLHHAGWPPQVQPVQIATEKLLISSLLSFGVR